MNQNVLLQRVCRKAHLLKVAYETNQDAYLAANVATQKWLDAMRSGELTKEMTLLVANADEGYDNSRDTIVTILGGLLDATNALLEASPLDEYKAMRKCALKLQEAFNSEREAFDAYSKALEDRTQKHELYEAARAGVISRGQPLLERILALSPCDLTMKGVHAAWHFDQVEGLASNGKPSTPPPPDPLEVKQVQRTYPLPESQIDTDLDGSTPAWQMAETDADRERILYENRKATLGQKAAGRMLVQDRMRAKRNAQTE